MVISDWEKRVQDSMAEGVPVFQKNGLPIICQRAFDGALLEHEHADHVSYLYPVDVQYVSDKPDAYRDNNVVKGQEPAHYRHDVEWNLVTGTAFCNACRRDLTSAEIVHQRAYSMAEINESEYEPHSEALIFYDKCVALTLYECCYTLWHRRGTGYNKGYCGPGAFLHGAPWNKDWRLTDEAIKKIWPSEDDSE